MNIFTKSITHRTHSFFLFLSNKIWCRLFNKICIHCHAYFNLFLSYNTHVYSRTDYNTWNTWWYLTIIMRLILSINANHVSWHFHEKKNFLLRLATSFLFYVNLISIFVKKKSSADLIPRNLDSYWFENIVLLSLLERSVWRKARKTSF